MIIMSIRKLLSINILLIGLLISGCENVKLETPAKLPFNMFGIQEGTVNSLINKEGLTIKDRYLPVEGHAVIVVDMAVNSSGEKSFLLAQSYMPAQQTQLLINPMDDDISPWYSLNDKERLITPQWTFDIDTLKSWNE